MKPQIILQHIVCKTLPVALVLCVIGLSQTVAQDVDVYFVVGQSNANNFVADGNTGDTSFDFTLHFARTSNQFNDFPNHTAVAREFSSSNLDASVAPTILASGLHQEGRDVAILSFARVGAGLNNNTTSEGDPWIWYPGADPANGQFFNDSLYANSIAWNEARLQGLRDDGLNPTIKGLFWFQGEKDARLLDGDVYRENFDNLVARFRQDYGNDLPVVATQIREITDESAFINDSLEAAALADPLLAFVRTDGLQFVTNADDNNVHLTDAGHAALAPRWSEAILSLQAVPEPSSLAILMLGGLAGLARRKRAS